MSTYQIGIRKKVENDNLRQWLIINAKITDNDDGVTKTEVQALKLPGSKELERLEFFKNRYWLLFVWITSVIEIVIVINFIFISEKYLIPIVIIVNITTIIYAIDFGAGVIYKIKAKNYKNVKMKKNWQLLLDAVSITPFSLVYLVLEQNPDLTDFLIYRLFTLLRLYRCFSDIGYHESVELYYWSLVFFGFAFSLYVSINANASEWVIFVSKQDYYDLDIVDWNLTSVNKFIVAMYYSITTSFNVGFGDIVPNSQQEAITILMIMLLGFIMLTGILPGIITIVLANKECEREDFRSEYEYTMYILKRNKIQKKVIDKISNNLQIFWDYRKGVTSTNIKELVPWSLRREIFYDINFGFLNRSLIFSLQPRSFLRRYPHPSLLRLFSHNIIRIHFFFFFLFNKKLKTFLSVSLLMTNISFLPGDIVIEPYEMSEAMLCIASGVLEILSEENDETPLLSFTAGTILGEASLFLTIPNKYVIRASTFLELQVKFIYTHTHT